MFQKRSRKRYLNRRRLFVAFLLGFLFLSNLNFIISEIKNTDIGRNIVDKIYLAKQNPNVVDKVKFGVGQVRAAENPSELEYSADIGPINGSASANYVYGSFFNPSGSGKTLVVKRIAVRVNAVTTANYINMAVRRTTAVSAVGTQITTANIPKKNSDSVDSVANVRHTIGTTGVTFAGTTDSRLLAQTSPGAVGQFHGYRDITFGANDEKLILQQNEGIALYQEAAGDADQRYRMYIEWEEVTSVPSAQNEFIFAFTRVNVAATANYVYDSFFNPVASGKTAIVKRVWFGTEACNGVAVYTNNIALRRTTSASGGTATTATNVPKKNTSGANSVMDFRRSGATVGLVGTADARLGLVTPCGTTGQPSGWQQMDFQQNDEKLILQQGEGIALISEAAGDVNQLVRMIVEWQEVPSASTPASQGEYMSAFHRISNEAVAPVANTSFYTFYNPAASGKTAVVKRLGIRNNADTAATYAGFSWRRLSTATGGSQLAATDIIKKHSGSSNSAMELRSCGTTCASAIVATYSGTTDSRILTVNGPGAAGQVIGQREVVFGDNEKLILQPGEGIGFYIDAAGDIDHYIKAFVEWDEETGAPPAGNEYLVDVGAINGSTTNGYKYASFFNPAASGKTAIIKKVSLRIDTVGSAVYIPMTLQRTTAASAGTQITAANIPKKHASTVNSAMEIRRTGATVTLAGSADSRMTGIQTAGAAGTAVAPSTSGYKEFAFKDDERIILQPGEGVTLHQEAAGNANFRVKVLFEWEEVASGSTPASQGEYLMSSGPVNGSLNANYAYSSLFNPSGTGKKYVVKRIELRVNRIGTATAPSYIPVTLRRVTSSSGGTAVAQANVPEKHSGTLATTAQISHTGPTVGFAGVTDSRLLGVTAPGAVNQYGDYESVIVYGDEMILKEGEGLALFQEAASGDANLRFRMAVEWSEVSAGTNSAPTLSVSQPDGVSDTVNVGQAYNITYDLADTEDVVTAAFYYDINATGLDGTTITGACATAAEGTSATCSWDTTGMTPGSYYVYGITNDGVNPAVNTYSSGVITIQVSANQKPNSPASLTQKTSPGGVGITESAWTTDNTPDLGFTVSDSDVGDTVKYQVQIAANSAFTTPIIDFTPTATSANPTTFTFTVGSYGSGTCTGSCPATLSDSATGYWWRVKGMDNNGEYSLNWSEFGVAGTMDIKVDATVPGAGNIFDNTNTVGQPSLSDTDNNDDGSLNTLSSSWSGFSDPTSGVQKYEFSIGTTAGGTDILGWTDNSTTAYVRRASLVLQTNQMYYFNVRATDNATNVSNVYSSNGLVVQPTLSFTLLGNNPLVFNNLNNGNTYTANLNSDPNFIQAKTSTNAYNGYVVYLSGGLLASIPYPSQTIAPFNGVDGLGASWTTPTLWDNTCMGAGTGRYCGFGYTSSDPLVVGVNRFTPGATPKYAPVNSTAPGDVVADHEGPINGSTGSVVDEIFNIMFRVSVPSSQTASKYEAAMTIIISSKY